MRFPTATGNDRVDAGYRMLFDYLRLSWDDSVRELAIDYVRTFIGHGVNGYSAAYPFESVYTSERRLMMQEARAEVLATLRENGLKRGTWTEGEDHIALELEFMQRMSMRTAEALQAGDEDTAIKELRTPARVRARPPAELAAHADRRHGQVCANEVLPRLGRAHDGLRRRGRGFARRAAGGRRGGRRLASGRTMLNVQEDAAYLSVPSAGPWSYTPNMRDSSVLKESWLTAQAPSFFSNANVALKARSSAGSASASW